MVQLSPVHPGAQLHDPSVCRHISSLQLGEHFLEQFLPKYPSSQTRDLNLYINTKKKKIINDIYDQTFKISSFQA